MIAAELRDFNTTNSISEQASQYWANHKEDIRKFLEWKMVQKVMDRVLPSEKPSQVAVAAASVAAGRSNTAGEEAIASRIAEGLDNDVVMEAPVVAPLKRKAIPNPKVNKTPKRAKSKIAKDTRLRKERGWKYIPENTFQFYLKG
jgi:hypothetical protein